MATTVYTKPPPDGSTGTLFTEFAFWVSANVPQRNRFKELIQINGGRIVLLEKDADIKLVDHAKRDIPLNSHSYTFVEQSIRKGQLEDLEDHRAGQSTRPVGAVGIPARSHRTPYTLQDDQILWDWMQPYEKRKDQIAGNVIYQQLAEQYPRHTFQSWRDRYLKRLRGNPRPGGPAPEADVSSPDQAESQKDVQQAPSPSKGVTAQASLTGKPSAQLSSTAKAIQSDAPRTLIVSEPVGTSDATNNHHMMRAPQDTKSAKRKRLSHEGPSTLSSFETDHAAKKRRRATDFVPRHDEYTPITNHEVPADRAESNSQKDISDESQSAKYETAPQYPLPTESQSQTQTSMTTELEYEDNFKALLELPYPAGARYDEEDDDDIAAVNEGESIEEWIQKRIDDGKSVDHILLALSCTSMNAELADQVLDLLHSGKGIPVDMPGVWTEEDDRDLFRGGDGRAAGRVFEKHSLKLCKQREKYLETSAKATQLIANEDGL